MFILQLLEQVRGEMSEEVFWKRPSCHLNVVTNSTTNWNAFFSKSCADAELSEFK